VSTEGNDVLLDDLMPVYDVAERHGTIVRAPADRVFAAIRESDLTGGPVTAVLLAVRILPAAVLAFLRSPRQARTEFQSRRVTSGERRGLRPFEKAGFRVVAEHAPEEVVIGLLGRFWTPRGGICAGVSAATFRSRPPSGQALAGWNFSVAALPDGSSVLRTETRVWCAPDARATFRAYWFVVRPGSGLIRRAMLRSIRPTAEERGGF
jgi:hypothetical protein